MTSRERFEAWMRENRPLVILRRHETQGPYLGEYMTGAARDQWDGWQASRRATITRAAEIVLDAGDENSAAHAAKILLMLKEDA